MAAISITPANVVAGSNAVRDIGVAGEAIVAGKPVYYDATTAKFMLADANSATAAARTATGIALNGASLNQPVSVHKFGDLAMGAVFTAGVAYYLGSAAAGTIVPVADLTTGDYTQLIGIAKSTSILAVDFVSAGVAL
jgi:hypothetical protein